MPNLRPKSQIKQNLDLWLNDLFLKDGFFTDVSVGETDIYSRDISLLSLATDESFADNMIWQSAFKNWVHESGLVTSYVGTTSPIVASGVTVDGIFYPKDSTAPGFDVAFAHSTDYVNGRIIFDAPITSSSVVQAEFSYKEIYVDFAATFENEQKEFFVETAYKDNPFQTGVVIYPDKNARVLPMVMIDVVGRTNEPYELGNIANIANLEVVLHIWSRDDYMRDQIEDLLTLQENSTTIGINFNTAPFPLDYLNDKNPSYTNYADFASLTSSHFWRRMYFDEVTARRSTPFYNIERTQVNITIRVYPLT